MSQACFTSARILGTCRQCRTAAREVHCPKRLKSLHCEACCPVCSPQVASNVEPSQAKELANA
jgi:hypothetical protein